VRLGSTAAMAGHRAELERQVAGGAILYAVNTGYGSDAGRVVPADAIARTQVNTIRSHAQGVGEPAPEPVVRGAMLVKAQAYAQGPAALRPEVAEGLVALLNARVHPVVPLQGSQSASGDLIPNAHIGLALMGEGEVVADGRRVAAADALPVPPLRPAMKDGVGLTNDCSFTAALAFDAVRAGRRLVERAEEVAAMTLQGLRGHPEAFDERLVNLRPHPGALRSAAHVRDLLAGSALLRAPGRPHDPYCLRCLPQVHGAVRDALDHAARAVAVEIAAVGDNPVVIAADGVTLSGGNFHGEPLALPLDGVAVAIAEVAALSQARTAHLVDPRWDVGLPAKLAPDPAEGFGLLMLNTAAAALVSEARVRARPASLESIGVDPMEDHVSMAAVAARGALAVLEIARRVVAIELACAGQAVEIQGVEHAAPAARALHAALRERVPFAAADGRVDVEPLVGLL
jgi:histidine ammonia-lyase